MKVQHNTKIKKKNLYTKMIEKKIGCNSNLDFTLKNNALFHWNSTGRSRPINRNWRRNLYIAIFTPVSYIYSTKQIVVKFGTHKIIINKYQNFRYTYYDGRIQGKLTIHHERKFMKGTAVRLLAAFHRKFYNIFFTTNVWMLRLY